MLYPLFIHTFLALAERGAPGDAARFMARGRRRFLEGAAHASKLRRQAGPLCLDPCAREPGTTNMRSTNSTWRGDVAEEGCEDRTSRAAINSVFRAM